MGISSLVGAVSLGAQGFLDDEQRTNGAETLGALASLQAKGAAGLARIGPDRAKARLEAIVISPDGYLITEATETRQMKPIQVWFPDGTGGEAREVKRDDRLDLLLLKVERAGLPVVTWGESASLRPGQWLCALTAATGTLRIGVLGANRRPISNSGAVMGVRFAPGDKGDQGVLIEEVAADGPAEEAGLRAEDVLMELDGQKVNEPGAVKRVISALHPGDVVNVRYLRGGKDSRCDVRLASKNRVMMNWVGEDFANYGTSHRTDNFPEVIQHDMPLDPTDMGGPVFDLQGRAIGINIARVDRVTNYVLPAGTFLAEVTRWIKADRVKK